MDTKTLRIGEPAPWFECASPVNPRFKFDTVGGHHIILCFYGSLTDQLAAEVIQGFLSQRSQFDDLNRCFFGVSIDPDDEQKGRIQEDLPGIHLFRDFDRQVSKLYGAASVASSGYEPRTFVLDERLRIVANIPFGDSAEQHVRAVMTALNSLPKLSPPVLADVPAPILIVPRVFEPELCRTLIQYYDRLGGTESGFMREVDGKTVLIHDYNHKRRRDQEILDESLRNACMVRVHDRILPEIQKAFQFRATRIERYIVSCYDSSTGGHFNAHRDNTTKGTAHRRFAVSLNLNTGEYEGGQIWFPEFGRQRYLAPAGGAVVFSCSLLHEATPVTAGSRYAFLPFLYDDEAARIRDRNRQFLALNPSDLGSP